MLPVRPDKTPPACLAHRHLLRIQTRVQWSQDCARLAGLLHPFWRSHCFLPHYLEVVREMLGPVYCASRCKSWGRGRVILLSLCCSQLLLLTSKEETAFLD